MTILLATATAAETFTVEGTACFRPTSHCILIRDDRGRSRPVYMAAVSSNLFNSVAHGDRIRASGRIKRESNASASPFTLKLEILSHGTPPEPADTSIRNINDGRNDDQIVRVRGIVRDCILDEVDPYFIYFILSDRGGSVYLTLFTRQRDQIPLARYLGAEVSVTGFVNAQPQQSGRILGKSVSLESIDAISILHPDTGQPEESPPFIAELEGMTAEEISVQGLHRVRGTVLAVWNQNRILLRTGTDSGRSRDYRDVCDIRLLDADQTPHPGQRIEAVGLPVSNLLNVNLVHARWHPTDGVPAPESAPLATDAFTLFSDRRRGLDRIKYDVHGRLARMQGRVVNTEEDRFTLESGGRLISVIRGNSPSPIPLPESGSSVEVTGIIALETENWSHASSCPRIYGMSLILRSKDDLGILTMPPWWTPKKFLVTSAALIFLLLLAGLRHIGLRRQAGRRMAERTRLATELHDHVSQDLTAVKMKLASAKRAETENRDDAAALIDSAARIINHTHTELRRCIMDLRSSVLDEPDLEKAIRTATSTIIGDATPLIDFKVPRKALDDSIANTVLSVIRELVSNAVLHGAATEIHIRGRLDGNHLRFAIEDDGTGFDPAAVPGISDGHFGLTGVRERIRALNGKFSIIARPGQGTVAKAVIPIGMNT